VVSFSKEIRARVADGAGVWLRRFVTVKDVKVFKSLNLNSNSGFFDKYTCFCYKLFKKKQFFNYNPNLKINFHKSCKYWNKLMSSGAPTNKACREQISS